MASRTVSVRELFDDTRFTPYQAWVSFLCFCLIVLDGFDLTLIGVTMPKIAEALRADPKALGLAIGAGQIGPLVGAIVFGMVADSMGRKRMLILSAIIFGFFTFLTAYITSVHQLAACRLFAGLGLGGAIPNALAFACEYSPTRLRASLTTMMWAGMPAGSLIGGLSAAYLLPHYGWQTLFMLGGALPILVALLVGIFLPESLEFLVRQGKDHARIRKIVSRITPNVAADPQVEFRVEEKRLAGVPLKHLFTDGRAFTTILLWVLFFWSFYLLWIVLAWAPTFLKKSGATIQQYSLAFSCINVGSLIATITIGRLMDRFDPFRSLKIVHVLAFVSMVAFGFAANNPFIIVAVMSVIMGIFVFGGNSGLVALATVSYPLDIRASGIGWAYAVGKVGSLLAPVAGGFVLSLNWSVSSICAINGLAAVFITIAIFILQAHLSAARQRETTQQTAAKQVA
jgi:MFS transporter, AAHS family, 4-hydroxybenzoate transporter